MLLESLVVADNPFAEEIDGPLRWVDPLIVVEVTYTEVTWAGTLRQPVMKGFAPEAVPETILLDGELAIRVDLRHDRRVRLAARQRL